LRFSPPSRVVSTLTYIYIYTYMYNVSTRILAVKYIQWTRLCKCAYERVYHICIYIYIYMQKGTFGRAKLEILKVLPRDYHHHPTFPPTFRHIYYNTQLWILIMLEIFSWSLHHVYIVVCEYRIYVLRAWACRKGSTGHLFDANGEKTNSPMSDRCFCSYGYDAYPPENRNCLGSGRADNGSGGDGVVGGGFRSGRRSSCACYAQHIVYIYTCLYVFILFRGRWIISRSIKCSPHAHNIYNKYKDQRPCQR